MYFTVAPSMHATVLPYVWVCMLNVAVLSSSVPLQPQHRTSACAPLPLRSPTDSTQPPLMIPTLIAPPHSDDADSDSASFRPKGAEMDENGTKKLRKLIRSRQLSPMGIMSPRGHLVAPGPHPLAHCT